MWLVLSRFVEEIVVQGDTARMYFEAFMLCIFPHINYQFFRFDDDFFFDVNIVASSVK